MVNWDLGAKYFLFGVGVIWCGYHILKTNSGISRIERELQEEQENRQTMTRREIPVTVCSVCKCYTGCTCKDQPPNLPKRRIKNGD